MNLVANIQSVLSLVQLGIAGVTSIVAAVRANQLVVQGEDGQELTAEQIETRAAAVEAHRADVGAGIESRIASREST
jgi:hypothetical protein